MLAKPRPSVAIIIADAREASTFRWPQGMAQDPTFADLEAIFVRTSNLDECPRWTRHRQELFPSKNQLAPSQTKDTVLNAMTVNGEAGSVKLPPC